MNVRKLSGATKTEIVVPGLAWMAAETFWHCSRRMSRDEGLLFTAAEENTSNASSALLSSITCDS